jgi:RNA polymerase sigma-70 factor (ECF subfamily)
LPPARSIPPSDDDSHEVTRLLRAAREGDRGSLDELLARLYVELRRTASDLLHRERKDHTLQPTALVHETWLKLAGQATLGFQDRAGFFAAAASAMRRILVDHARTRKREKRGGGLAPEPLDETLLAVEQGSGDLIELDAALEQLAGLDSRKAKLVELRFFAGLPTREAAVALSISERQAERDLVFARAWLRNRLDRVSR